MFYLSCTNCGTVMGVPNVLRCPYCNKDLSRASDQLSAKHVRKCAVYLNPRKYSDRGPGRPSNKERRRFLEDVMNE